MANPTPDILDEDLPRLFERFWRKDPSRTGTRQSGLGLSLASELAATLGGTLTASKSAEGVLLVFVLDLPSGSGDAGGASLSTGWTVQTAPAGDPG